MDDPIQRARQGDSEAFVALFEQSRKTLWRAAMAVLDNAEDAADALQETAIKAWRAMPRFEGHSNVETWFVRILLHTCYDLRTKRQRETPYAPQSLVDGASQPCRVDGCTAVSSDTFRLIIGDKHRADQDEAMDVRRSLAQLSADDRLILSLFYVSDFSTQHIATILNVSEGAVRARLTRARSRFKEAYRCDDDQKVEVAR